MNLPLHFIWTGLVAAETLTPWVAAEPVEEIVLPDPEPVAVYYELTEEERQLVEATVYHEAGNQGVTGQMLVAQCILDGCELNDISVNDVLARYQYAWSDYSLVTDEVREAVERVFDDGEFVVEDKILFYYNPKMCVSTWHESQTFVIEYKAHRFFKLNS